MTFRIRQRVAEPPQSIKGGFQKCACALRPNISGPRRYIIQLPYPQAFHISLPEIEPGQGRGAPLQEPPRPHPKLRPTQLQISQPTGAYGSILVAAIQGGKGFDPLQGALHSSPARKAQLVPPGYCRACVCVCVCVCDRMSWIARACVI